MVCTKSAEFQITDRKGKILKKVENFRYLGSMIHATSGSEEDVKDRVAVAWKKWCDLTGVLCDQRMPVSVKGKVYGTMIRPVLIYDTEA